jgi:hypothetical protein
MTTAIFNVPAARQVAVPRGARVAAGLFVRALSWLGRPAAPRVLSRSAEAAAVRALAFEVRHTDPGFAADLYAAAARHESLGD